MGRHTVAAPVKKPRRNLVLSIVAAAAVVGVVGSGVFLWVGGHLDPLLANADTACTEPEQLAIVADRSIAPALATAIEETYTRPRVRWSVRVRPVKPSQSCTRPVNSAVMPPAMWTISP